MQTRAVIFDLDGTLVDSLADIAGAMNTALRACGYPPRQLDEYRQLVGEGARRLAERAAPKDASVSAVLAAYERAYASAFAVHTRPYPGVLVMLEGLAARGVPLAILSNKPHAATCAVTARCLPGVRFVAVHGQRDGVPRKPDPQAALAIAGELGVPTVEVAFVGDTAVDFATARAAGMRAIGVSWGFRPDESQGADVVVADADALLAALLSGA